MNIEISEEKYWKYLTYHDGLLYCQLLEIDGKNDWRMVKDDTEYNYIVEFQDIPYGWCYIDFNINTVELFWIVPIRDKPS